MQSILPFFSSFFCNAGVRVDLFFKLAHAAPCLVGPSTSDTAAVLLGKAVLTIIHVGGRLVFSMWTFWLFCKTLVISKITERVSNLTAHRFKSRINCVSFQRYEGRLHRPRRASKWNGTAWMQDAVEPWVVDIKGLWGSGVVLALCQSKKINK